MLILLVSKPHLRCKYYCDVFKVWVEVCTFRTLICYSLVLKYVQILILPCITEISINLNYAL